MGDLIQELGPLALASRLKRLSDRLYRDISAVYAELDVDFESRWFPVLMMLSRQEAMGVTEIAEAVGLTHPAVHQIAASMSKAGLVDSSKDATDQRRRLLRLTGEGRALVHELQPTWQAIAQATHELLDEIGGDFLPTVSALEDRLARASMYTRVVERATRTSGITIVEFAPAHAAAFRELNLEWLTEHFEVEPLDRETLDHPERIIEEGGDILFAATGDTMIGTVALLKHDAGTVEVAKMAVAKAARGRGAGRALMRAAIARARELGASRLVLETSDRLEAATHLYRRFGFRPVARDDPNHPANAHRYRRPTVAMVLDLV